MADKDVLAVYIMASRDMADAVEAANELSDEDFTMLWKTLRYKGKQSPENQEVNDFLGNDILDSITVLAHSRAIREGSRPWTTK